MTLPNSRDIWDMLWFTRLKRGLKSVLWGHRHHFWPRQIAVFELNRTDQNKKFMSSKKSKEIKWVIRFQSLPLLSAFRAKKKFTIRSATSFIRSNSNRNKSALMAMPTTRWLVNSLNSKYRKIVQLRNQFLFTKICSKRNGKQNSQFSARSSICCPQNCSIRHQSASMSTDVLKTSSEKPCGPLLSGT